MVTRVVEWTFDQPPHAVWPLLADTARFNEAAGLPKHPVRREEQPDGTVRFFAEARLGPFDLAWEEIPVEWVADRWFRHERRFRRGPLARLTATAELRPTAAAGTVCRYVLEAEPAGLVGRAVLGGGFLKAAEKGFARLIEGVRAHLDGRRPVAYASPRPPLDAAGRQRLERLVAEIEASGNGHGLAGRLAELVRTGQDLDVERIRPIALARRWGEPERPVVELCLQAVRDGMLESRWDILCPRCRGARLAATSLDRVPSRAHCDSCNISYDRDFVANVELSFHPAPSVRPVTEGEFCLFGPMSTPHVFAQVSLDPGERRTLAADPEPGSWRYRTLEPGGQVDVTVGPAGVPALVVGADGVTAGPAVEGGLALENRDTRRRTVVVESRRWVEDALTAQRATTLQAFRDLFADEVLKPGDEVAIAQIALLFTDLSGSTALYERIGDAAAYHLVREHFAFLTRTVRDHDGAVVKTIGDAVMAAFAEPADAVRAAVAVQAAVAGFNREQGRSDGLAIKMGVHAGHCIAVTLNDRLDYFGSMVNLAARLQGLARSGEVLVSGSLAADPRVREVLAGVVPGIRERATVRGVAEPVDVLRLSGPFAAPEPAA